jgi:hypothetical protein
MMHMHVQYRQESVRIALKAICFDRRPHSRLAQDEVGELV